MAAVLRLCQEWKKDINYFACKSILPNSVIYHKTQLTYILLFQWWTEVNFWGYSWP